MTSPAAVQNEYTYAATLNALRTKLAAVVSTIDATNKYLIDGAITPELIMYTSESTIDGELQKLEDMHQQVMDMVDTLSKLEVPSENTGGSS